jgi:hypothetical protein
MLEICENCPQLNYRLAFNYLKLHFPFLAGMLNTIQVYLASIIMLI